MDYTPCSGPKLAVDFTFGIIKRSHAGRINTVGEAIVRRLSPHRTGAIDCYDHEVLLPGLAPDCLRRLDQLVLTYEDQLLPEQDDLLGIATVRFERGMLFHRQWELARAWVRTSFNARDLAAVMVHHVPSLAARPHKPHVHVLYPVRTLQGTFGPFVHLSRATLAAEWQAHLDSS
jgi:hypothetical protein